MRVQALVFFSWMAPDEIRFGSIPERPAGFSEPGAGGGRKRAKKAKPATDADDSFEPSAERQPEEPIEDRYEPSEGGGGETDG